MLTVTQSQDGTTLYVKSHFFYSSRIRNIPTATWVPDQKVWTISKAYAYLLEQAFHDEIYYKTPEWVIFNQPMPDYSSMYAIDPNITVQPIKGTPYDYQVFGARFAIDRINTHQFCIIADDVGLGKTLQAILVMLDQVQNKRTHKIIIICKKSIKTQWRDELLKFTDLDKQFTIEVVTGAKRKRDKAYANIQSTTDGILITNYQSFLNDQAQIASIGFDFTLIDEAHVVSGHDTKMNKLIQKTIHGKPCLFLTGTPVMNKPEQAYGIISMASPKYFHSWKQFREQFLVESRQGNYTVTVGAKNLSVLRSMIQDVMIRRTEYEVSVQLPKTMESMIKCDRDAVQEELIEAIKVKREGLMVDFESKMKIYQSNPNPQLYQQLQMTDGQLKGLIAATQATADDPRMFFRSSSKFLQHNFLSFVPSTYAGSDKIEKTIDMVDNIASSGNKVIIFTKFRTSAVLLQEEIKKSLKIDGLLYTGQEDDTVRDMNINLFKNDDTYPVLIATEAGAEGLNLVVARYVINFNLPDTAAIYTQRIGRIRRVSSTFNSVTVYNMITEGSKDEERWDNIQKNKDLEGALVNVSVEQQQALINAMNGG